MLPPASVPAVVRVVAPFPQLTARQWATLPKEAPSPPTPSRKGPNGREFDELPRAFKPHQPQIDEDTEVVQAISDNKGHWYLATTFGLILTDGKGWWQPIDHKDGMPQIRMTSVALAPNGDLWGGTRSGGVWRLREGKFRYFASRRWLPSDTVQRVWCDSQNRCWVETPLGYACIEEKTLTLAEKAAHFETITAKYHDRRGYISDCSYKVTGQPEKGVFPNASDNDGLWTAIYLGAECLRYAATKSEEAKAKAKKSLHALLELERLTGIPGFPARATLTDDELKAGVTGLDPKGTVNIAGDTTLIWFRSPIEKNVWVKGDTSSDEIDGHYFAWFLYSEHVANTEEKKRIAATCKRVTDHILNHNYTLIDHTGRPTRWGHWEPELMNDSPRWKEERGLNALEILSHLKVALHLTGEKRYEEAYEKLIKEHHYLLNTLNYRRNSPWWKLNHSDDELAYLAYYPLMLLEKDPARKQILAQSIAKTWEPSLTEQTIKAEASPFYNFSYGALTGNPCDAESALVTLQDWPLDQTDWKIANSTRMDVTLRLPPGGGRNRMETDRVLSPAERRVTRWNACYWEADSGGEGRGADDPGAWLLGYWLGVYHGFLAQ